MDVSCVMIELKPNSLQRVKEWVAFIQENEDEAISTLKNEKVTIESYFLTKIGEADYLIVYMRAASIAHAQETVKNSLSAVDAYHKKFQKDTWVRGERAKLLIDLNRVIDERINA